MIKLVVGCHVSAAGGVWNAPKNARALECETFQIFTRPPMGGKAPVIDKQGMEKFKSELKTYGYDKSIFVVHCPYFVNFGSANPRIFHGSVSVVREELERASLLGAKYVMTHLGSLKDLGKEKGIVQVKKGLKEVLKGYKGESQFLLEIAAGSGETIGGNFEQLAELMEPLLKTKGFGGICFDTQHAFASGYDLRDDKAVKATFERFNHVIGLEWLKMSHINDSKVDLGARKDRHEHINEGKIGEKGFGSMLKFISKNQKSLTPSPLSRKGEGESNKVAFGSFPLILETEHDKVKADIKLLKKIRDTK